VLYDDGDVEMQKAAARVRPLRGPAAAPQRTLRHARHAHVAIVVGRAAKALPKLALGAAARLADAACGGTDEAAAGCAAECSGAEDLVAPLKGVKLALLEEVPEDDRISLSLATPPRSHASPRSQTMIEPHRPWSLPGAHHPWSHDHCRCVAGPLCD
jgi:hypothetical protein